MSLKTFLTLTILAAIACGGSTENTSRGSSINADGANGNVDRGSPGADNGASSTDDGPSTATKSDNDGGVGA